jgi:hypothetical protein
MDLSIIITTYKNPELLRVCIDSIKRNYTGQDYEIIVADSETEERTSLMMREDYPEIRFIAFKENVGFQVLVKEAYKISHGENILILNGDIITKKNSIEQLLEYVRTHPEVGIVGPQLLNFNDTLQYSSFRYYKPITIVYRRTFLGKMEFAKKHVDSFLMKDFDHKSVKEVDWLMGSALMARREAIEKVGPMDSQFKMYFEDVDWCRRFWENDFKVVYFPSAQMYHYHGKGSAGKSLIKTLVANKLAWLHIRSAIKYFIKYWGKSLPNHN